MNQSTGNCRREFSWIFDVEDTERMVVMFQETYEGNWCCYAGPHDSMKRYEDCDVPWGMQPDFILAEHAANWFLKFNKLT